MAGGIGHCAALVLLIQTNGAELSWYATDWVYQVGGMI